MIKQDSYLKLLENLDKFDLVQLDMKQSQYYKESVEELADYLSEVYMRMCPENSIRERIEKMFENEWYNGSLYGW